DLRVDNGVRVAALCIGTYDLHLPSSQVLELDNCYYVSVLSRNIISISCLDKKGVTFIIKDNKFSFSYDDVYYGCAIMSNGLYVIDLVLKFSMLIPKDP
ncbi:hypothetical protein, partial [Bartonella sp. OT172YNZD]|uniref:hypothetical protein n=1 Tax=Bartonella sp. OT172YNZD TaxID=3243572 RepID=UPI0035CF4213